MYESIFKKRQKDLLDLANTEAGRHLLGIKSDLPIVKLSPNSWHLFNGREIEATFFCGNNIAHTVIPILDKLDIALDDSTKMYLKAKETFKKKAEIPWIYLTTGTYYAGNSNGWAGVYSDANEVWATKRTDANGTVVQGQGSTNINQLHAQNGATGILNRLYAPKDTSSIGAGAIVTAATDMMYVVTVTNPDSISLACAMTTQADPTTVVLADYSKVTVNTPTEIITRVTYASLTTGAQNSFVFNASGIAAVNVTGTTKIGYRTSSDIDNSQSAGSNFLNVKGASDATQANQPQLSVTYTPISGGTLPMMGV